MRNLRIFQAITHEKEIPALFHFEDQVGVSHQIPYGKMLPVS
jgi:hypothetical protein